MPNRPNCVTILSLGINLLLSRERIGRRESVCLGSVEGEGKKGEGNEKVEGKRRKELGR